jgi:class 3 adenylate cyclase
MTRVSEQPVDDQVVEPIASGRLNRFRRSRILARVSIQSKLILMLVLCTILAATVVGAIAFSVGRTGLRTAVFNRLTQTEQAQTRALASQLTDLKNSMIIYSHGATAGDALQAFSTGFDQLAGSSINPAQSQAIADYYNNDFIKQAKANSGVTLDVSALLPTSNAQRYLQANYTARRKDDQAAIGMTDAGDGSVWSAANARYQDYFREIVDKFEFEDALLINSRGDAVYTAFKDVDLGTNFLNGPYNGSKLHNAFLKAMSANEVEYVAVTDFELYQPAEMQPIAWMVAPIVSGGRTQGALALQFPVSKINRLMTFNKQWKGAGLQETGETFLVGEDGLMRSDSRLFLENPQQYVKEVTAAGTPHDVAELAVKHGGTTLIQPVESQATKNARNGLSGTLVAKDYFGRQTLQAYAPLVVPGTELQWSIIAKIDTAEAFERESSFTRTMVLTTTTMIFGVCVLAIYLAQIFVRPLRKLEAGVERVSAGDYNVAIPVETRDQIGDLTHAFNEMSRSLAIKEDLLAAQQKEIDTILKSLMPEPVVDRYREGEETIAAEHHNVTVVFADIIGLDQLQVNLPAAEFLELINELIRQIDLAADDHGVERVRTVRNGYLGSCGLTVPRLDNARRTVDFALECEQIVQRFNSEVGTDLRIRAGIDSGDVGSGLVGRPSVVFDMWGAAVNLAFQVKEGSAQPGIYVTSRVYEPLEDNLSFRDAGTLTIDGQPQRIWRVAAANA